MNQLLRVAKCYISKYFSYQIERNPKGLQKSSSVFNLIFRAIFFYRTQRRFMGTPNEQITESHLSRLAGLVKINYAKRGCVCTRKKSSQQWFGRLQFSSKPQFIILPKMQIRVDPLKTKSVKCLIKQETNFPSVKLRICIMLTSGKALHYHIVFISRIVADLFCDMYVIPCLLYEGLNPINHLLICLCNWLDWWQIDSKCRNCAIF